jgi:protein-tyrosine-phosphatase
MRLPPFRDTIALEEENMSKTVLLVCTGNTCRSVMAQGILLELLKDLGEDQHLQVLSAGVAAALGGEASDEALQILDERGIDLGRHRSRPVTEDLLASANLVLTMTGSQRDIIHRLYPDEAGKVQSLKEYVNEAGDIEDPIGLPVSLYRKTAKQLERLLLKAAKKLLREMED